MKALTTEEREVGRDNYHEAVGVTRRDFLLANVLGAGALSTAGLGAAYFNYQKVSDPVRIGVIGTGDEGNVLIGAMNPNYVQVVAIADIRPYNIHRAFHGDWGGGDPNFTHSIRTGLMDKFGWKTEDEARKHVKVYDKDYHDLIADKDVEAVIIALPLHLHAKVSVECLKAGKHVLTEKLMAHNVAQCKVMARVAEQTGLCLATGHQRHYSVLYDNAVNLLRWGVLGQLHHIRAQWHRNNMPGNDSWQPPLPGGEMGIVNGKKVKIDKIADQYNRLKGAYNAEKDPVRRKLLQHQVAQWEAWNRDVGLKAEDYDYHEITLSNGRLRTAMEELVRWRIWDRTGGGLMAELGSHQLDAASIFCSALRKDGKKAHPITVHAIGGRHIFPLDRHAEDHVYCMFEFPGPEYEAGFDVGYRDPISNTPDPEGIPSYEKDPNKKVVVTYSSINGNDFGGYGEVVMGTKGTLILEREQEVLLYKSADVSTRISVKGDKGAAVLDTQASGRPTAALAKAVEAVGPVSKGYTEEIEHWAWCIRNKAPSELRCKPEVAMGDAVIALTTNVAIKKSINGEAGYVKFDEKWFDVHSDETPDGSSIETEMKNLGA